MLLTLQADIHTSFKDPVKNYLRVRKVFNCETYAVGVGEGPSEAAKIITVKIVALVHISLSDFFLLVLG